MANQRLYLQFGDLRICLAKRNATEWFNAKELEYLDNFLDEARDESGSETIKLFYENNDDPYFDTLFEIINDSSNLLKQKTRLPTIPDL